MDRQAAEEEIVIRALEETLPSRDIEKSVSRLAEGIARREARRALRRAVRPFLHGEEPPKRPADQLALSRYFSTTVQESPESPTLPQGKEVPHPRTKVERERYAREFFGHVFREASSTLEDFHPARVRVFFRLARELARHTGALDDGQTLADLSTWTKSLRAREVLGRYAQTSKLLRAGPDLPLLPPPAPDSLDGYDPATDAPLVHYCASLAAIAEDLRVYQGTDLEPYLGRYGVRGLLDPELVRLACPSPEEVLDWEAQLVQDTLQIYTSRGTNGTHSWLKAEHGLSQREALPLIRAATAEAVKRTEGDLEERRAIMILQLEDLARRARRTLIVPHELSVRKLQAIVGGFTKAEPENMLNEFVGVVRKVNGESPALQLDKDDDA